MNGRGRAGEAESATWPHLGLFLSLAFLITWLGAGAFWMFEARDDNQAGNVVLAFSYVGVWGPSLAGIVTAWLTEGRAAAGHLVARLWRRPGGWRWPLIGLALPVGIYLLAAVIGAVFGQYRFAKAFSFDVTRLATFALLTLPSGPLGEEFGWRGYALPRLARRVPPLAAALIIGLCWALWHLPAFVVPDLQDLIFPTGVTFWPLAVVITSGGVILAWVTFHARNALLPAVLLHFGMLTALLAVGQTPPPVLTWATAALYGATASLIAWRDPRLGCGERSSA